MSMPAESIASCATLEQLLDGIAAAPPIEVAGIASDSRKVMPGFLFLACQGATSHGLDFVEQAEAAGAVAIAWDAATASAVP
ncbi:MAG: Mur ligase domain-containing protein, partial [Gammaproteobacteria bacterium]|nr:Mur ligase domain-containing protein [Gammaproteobacteria bacterium]